MKRGLITTILTITCLMMIFGVFQVSAQETTDANVNVMNINGTMISQEQFQRELTTELNKDADKSITEDELKATAQKVVEKIVRNELLYQECQKNNIVVNDDEINEKLNEEKSKYASPEEYQESLKNSNKDEEIRKAEIKRNIAISRLINEKFQPTVTEKEISKYYKDNPDAYKNKDISLEEAKDKIERTLKLQKIADSYNEFYAEIKSKAKIEMSFE